jgi:hypothetical protein
MEQYYKIGTRVYFANPRNPTHWCSGKFGTIVEIKERTGRPKYHMVASIDGTNKDIIWLSSNLNKKSRDVLKVSGLTKHVIPIKHKMI